MARGKKSGTYESNIALAKKKLHEKPRFALTYIGQFLVKELKREAPKSKKKRTVKINGKVVTIKPGGLRRYHQYWVRKKEGDLQVGSKSFYAIFEELGSSTNPATHYMMNTVMKHKDVIQEMITDALKELNKK